MWSAYPQDGDPDVDVHRRMSAPENEIPVAVPLNTLLARTPDVAVALTGLQVYSTGVSFDLAFRVRSPLDAAHRGLSDLVFEHGPSAGRFLLGIELADGRRASNVFGRDTDDGIVFHAGGGGGGELSVDQSWWLHPLPPEGPVRFVLGCAALGIEETSTVIDGGLLRRAAADVVVRRAPGPEGHDRPPPPAPDLPSDSWFAGS